MKSLKISIVETLIFVLGITAASAQDTTATENYYSNPRIGKQPTQVAPYSGNDAVTSKSDDLTIEVQGEDNPNGKESIKGKYDSSYYDYEYTARINRFHRDMTLDYYNDYYTNLYWYTHDPLFWGTSIYWG